MGLFIQCFFQSGLSYCVFFILYRYPLYTNIIIYIKNDPKIKISLIEVWSKLLCFVFVNYLLFFLIYARIISTKESTTMQLTYEIDFHEREFEEMVLVIICARSLLCAPSVSKARLFLYF